MKEPQLARESAFRVLALASVGMQLVSGCGREPDGRHHDAIDTR